MAPCHQLLAALSGPRSTSINFLSILPTVAWTQGLYKASMLLSSWYLQPFATAPTSPMTPTKRISSWWTSGFTAATLQLFQMQLSWVSDVLPEHAAKIRLLWRSTLAADLVVSQLSAGCDGCSCTMWRHCCPSRRVWQLGPAYAWPYARQPAVGIGAKLDQLAMSMMFCQWQCIAAYRSADNPEHGQVCPEVHSGGAPLVAAQQWL